MHFAERFVDGGYAVYAAAIEATEAPGFYAAVVVKQREEANCEVFREERLVHGSIWRFPLDALTVAVCAGLVVAHERREAVAEQAVSTFAQPEQPRKQQNCSDFLS